jgi:hypothetical protein
MLPSWSSFEQMPHMSHATYHIWTREHLHRLHMLESHQHMHHLEQNTSRMLCLHGNCTDGLISACCRHAEAPGTAGILQARLHPCYIPANPSFCHVMANRLATFTGDQARLQCCCAVVNTDSVPLRGSANLAAAYCSNPSTLAGKLCGGGVGGSPWLSSRPCASIASAPKILRNFFCCHRSKTEDASVRTGGSSGKDLPRAVPLPPFDA